METAVGNSIYVPIQPLDSLLRLPKAVITARVILRCGDVGACSLQVQIASYSQRPKKKKKKTTTSQERQDLNKKKQTLNNNE